MSPFTLISKLYLSTSSTANSIQQTSDALINDLRDRIHFLTEFFKDPLANGSVIPSSPHLTKKIIKYIPKESESHESHPKGRRYLEVGPGTGPFTAAIISRLKPNDHLDIVELNSSFCETLEKKYGEHKNVHIHCLSITDWAPEEKYDAVISGLPLNAFSPELVEKCLGVFKKVTKNNGTVSYFEYPNISRICMAVYYGENKKRLEKVLEIKNEFLNTYGFNSKIVEKNFPTAKVLHFRMKANEESGKEETAVPTVPNPA